MTNQSELHLWLALYLCKGLGVSQLKRLQQKIPLQKLPLSDYQQLLSLGLKPDIAQSLCHTNWGYIDQLNKYMQQQEITVLCYFAEDYPELLKQISSPPLLLFCRGQIELLAQPQLAMVGSRSATPAGLKNAAELAQQLTCHDIVITSGLALGVDSAAHRGALLHGKTIAVLGTGVDVVYPKRNQQLVAQILQQGLLVSEFLPGTKPQANNFPRRNRIISGLALGTLVVEAECKSGSLITAKYALEQNREVFAVPGSVQNPLTTGCHQLIKQGAKLVEQVTDILEELNIPAQSCLYTQEQLMLDDDPVLMQLGFEVTSVDELAQRLQLPISQIVTRLLDLELEDKVQKVADGYIRIC